MEKVGERELILERGKPVKRKRRMKAKRKKDKENNMAKDALR